MQNFQQILTEAAQLKQSQLKKDRKGYESLPQFLKSGLGYNKKYELIRKQNIHYQYRISNRVKEQGNILFKEGKFDEALSRYEEALAIFRYIQSKTYDNMKDEDLTYKMYDLGQLQAETKDRVQTHLCAIYLNISSCLTKLNKKQDAIYSAQQALKLRKTAKGHYKKAQAYLKYVNRDANDIKLGLLQLKQAYSIEKDPGILSQMHSVKENYQKQQEKSKNWFKFMFDKNKKVQQPVKQKQPEKEKPKQQLNPQNQAQRKQMQQLEKAAQGAIDEKLKFQQTKQKLRHYISLPQNEWLYSYQKDFIKRNGSKIYSILKIYKQQQLAAQLRSMLAKCLQTEQNLQKGAVVSKQCIEWLRVHQIPQISKYVQRYDLQTAWIIGNRKQMPIKIAKKQQDPIEQTMIKEENLRFQTFYSQQQEKQQKMSSRKAANQKKFNQLRKDLQFEQEQRRKAFKINEPTVPTTNKMTKQEKKKYITIGIILFLLLARFLWS